MKLIKLFYNWYWKRWPPEMVRYFKQDIHAMARGRLRMTDKGIVMDIEGEKYPFPGFPRGTILLASYKHTNLSILKHRIKNEIFNWAWAELEKETPIKEIIPEIKKRLFKDIYTVMEKSKYDMLPADKMCVAVRELWRAMTEMEKRHKSEKIRKLKEILCFILNEDDGYRMRVQWLCNYFNPSSIFQKIFKNPLKTFELALAMIEHAEVVDDMKGKQRLLKRVIMLCLQDYNIRALFEELCREVDWNKVKLSKADKYYLRGKYFKCDYKIYSY